VEFVRCAFGEELHPKQRAMMRSLVANRRTSVVGANGTGKDFCVSRMVPWWLTMRQPGVVIIIGPTQRQVQGVVWDLVRDGYHKALSRGYVLAGRVLESPRWTVGDGWYALGFSVGDAPGNEFNLQGFHSPHLLAIVTEAHAVPDRHFEALDRLNPERVVITGNPFVSAGRFHASHHGQRQFWHAISISAFDTPNVAARQLAVPGLVTWDDVEERRQMYGEDNPLYRSGVLCEWAAGADDAVVPINWAIRASESTLCSACGGPAVPAVHTCSAPVPAPVIGVDVARYGQDSTVVLRRDGPVVRLLWRAHGKDTQEVAGWVRGYCLAAGRDEAGAVVVDEVGLGAGVVDRLRESGLGRWRLSPFIGGSQARDHSRFVNRITEAWWMMREAFREGRICIPADASLIAQLTGRTYRIEGDARLAIESKDDYRRRGLPSPDAADALAMTFASGEAVTAGGAKGAGMFGRRDVVRAGVRGLPGPDWSRRLWG
jgi:hypothetical protein